MPTREFFEEGKKNYQLGMLNLKKSVSREDYEKVLTAMSQANPYRVRQGFRNFLIGRPEYLFTPGDIARVVENPRFVGDEAGTYFLFDPESDKNILAAPLAFLAKGIQIGGVKVNVYGRFQHFIALESQGDLTGELDRKLKIRGANSVAKKHGIGLSEADYGTCYWGLPNFPSKEPMRIKGRVLPLARRVFRGELRRTSPENLAAKVATEEEAMRENWLFKLGFMW